jgi:hypothetical protein
LIGSGRGLKKLGKPIDGVLVEDELIPESMRACLDLTPRCPSGAGERRRDGDDVHPVDVAGDRVRCGRAAGEHVDWVHAE